MKFKVIHLKQLVATIVVATLVLAATGIQWYIQQGQMLQTGVSPMKGKKILIDPGHGGFDAGASDNGAVEKELNLAVAKYLKEFVEAGGGQVYMTRETDVDTADPNRGKGVTQKKSDLQMRKSDIERYNADIFISIHMNKFEKPQYRGAQVFYDSSSEESKQLAEVVQQAVKDVLGDDNNRVAKNTGDDIYVLRDNKVPSILIECGFLSNSEESKKLMTPDYQDVAEGIYTGLLKFYSKNN